MPLRSSPSSSLHQFHFYPPYCSGNYSRANRLKGFLVAWPGSPFPNQNPAPVVSLRSDSSDLAILTFSCTRLTFLPSLVYRGEYDVFPLRVSNVDSIDSCLMMMVAAVVMILLLWLCGHYGYVHLIQLLPATRVRQLPSLMHCIAPNAKSTLRSLIPALAKKCACENRNRITQGRWLPRVKEPLHRPTSRLLPQGARLDKPRTPHNRQLRERLVKMSP